MSPLLPKGKRPWQDDPGHIHERPLPPDELEVLPAAVGEDHQEHPGVDIPAVDSITTRQASEEAREPHGEPAPVPEPSEVKVPRPLAQEIRAAMKRYPEKRSASIPALWAVQRRYGYCSPEGIEQAAAVMEVTPAYLESVASFYDLFHLEPTGTHQVLVCTNISCWLRGADDLLAAFKDAAATPKVPTRKAPRPGTPGREAEEAPEDVAVRGFECLGACDIAPMASIDQRYYGPLEDGEAVTAIEQLRNGEDVLPEKRLQDRGAAGGPRNPADKRITRHKMNKPQRPRPKRAPKSRAEQKAAPDAKRRSRR